MLRHIIIAACGLLIADAAKVMAPATLVSPAPKSEVSGKFPYILRFAEPISKQRVSTSDRTIRLYNLADNSQAASLPCQRVEVLHNERYAMFLFEENQCAMTLGALQMHMLFVGVWVTERRRMLHQDLCNDY